MEKIRKGDRVQVLAGKDAGKQGRVISVSPGKNKVMVEGVHKVKRHEKIRQSQGRGGQEGGIIEKELPIHLSNVGLICRTDGVARVGFRIETDGSKVRICRKCEADL